MLANFSQIISGNLIFDLLPKLKKINNTLIERPANENIDKEN